jgi:hypothetical protein
MILYYQIKRQVICFQRHQGWFEVVRVLYHWDTLCSAGPREGRAGRAGSAGVTLRELRP